MKEAYDIAAKRIQHSQQQNKENYDKKEKDIYRAAQRLGDHSPVYQLVLERDPKSKEPTPNVARRPPTPYRVSERGEASSPAAEVESDNSPPNENVFDNPENRDVDTGSDLQVNQEPPETSFSTAGSSPERYTRPRRYVRPPDHLHYPTLGNPSSFPLVNVLQSPYPNMPIRPPLFYQPTGQFRMPWNLPVPYIRC
eukprot:Seg1132.4 transcript_id=Seg1132.4/GoldUCD/mRNA.D3Y31 product="hypothetical protein" protein_id=Seg1132.4/GoldUCD/D3Y31